MKNSTLKNRTILISGASVAGPALAYWLSRYGFEPTVVERAPAPRSGGNAIDIRGGSREVAERMGIMPAVRQALTQQRGMSFVNQEGQPQATMSVELFNGEGLVSDCEILRSDLVDILYQASKDSTEYLFNDSITSLTEVTDGVRVTFEKGQPRTFDLVMERKTTLSREAACQAHLQAIKLHLSPNGARLSPSAREQDAQISLSCALSRLQFDINSCEA